MTAVNLHTCLDSSELLWVHNPPDPRFSYPIDYDFAVLGYQQDFGRLDLLIRWAPNSFCHFHRHIGATTTLVLEGEHHVIDLDEKGQEIGHDVRPAGDYRTSPGGDLHVERGGPDGSLVLFAMFEPSGRMFEILDDDRNLIAPVTIDSLLELAGELG